jgi:DNA excision repair protein ERCC-6-like 2
MVFTDSEEDDDFDLDAPPSRPLPNPRSNGIRKPLPLADVGPGTPAEDDTSSPAQEDFKSKRPKPPIGKPTKVKWSDDEEDDDGLTYKKWKARKSDARSKAVKAGRKAKAVEEERNPAPKPQGRSGKTGVGRRAPKRKRKAEGKGYGDSTSEDDDLMEWTMPDYVQERRARFDKRRDRLKEGGLDLPPTYDDVYFSDNGRLRYLKERPDFPMVTPSAPYKDIELPYSLGLIPAPIAQYLREYQVKGAAFLHELFVYQKGGILGDDMGLGKTIQVIAFLTAAYGKTGDERDKKRMRKLRKVKASYPKTLIICPGSLMANWQDELKRWGWWHVDLYHGTPAHKDEVLGQVKAGMLEITVTTYDTYRLSSGAINMIPWNCVIADECHKIKERKTSTTKILNEVNALCRIGLTGTAIQNKYEELWTLLNWTNPGKLGPVSTWKASICDPLKLGQSHDASNYQLARARKTAKMLVQNLLPQFFLRRTKDLIRDQLPKKTDRVVFCPLTATQADAYQRFLDSEIVQKIKNSSLPCHCGSKKNQGWCHEMTLEDGSKWQQWVFPAISTLQKLSNHLANLIPQSADAQEKQARDLEYLQIVVPDDWRSLYKNRDSILHSGNPEFCGKWRVLKKLLKFWHDEGSNKVLVFSHSVRLLRMLQNLFINTSYNVCYLDGSMSYEDRYAAVQDFNTDPTQFVFLISTRAGGVGLNITSANKVVVVDPNWNPAYDLQAQDRAYRIGQTRDVEVFRLVSQGTLEEIVYARQIYKQQQANIGYNATSERRYFQGVQDRKDQKGEIFGLTNLFAYQTENVVLRDIVNKTNIAESRADVRVANLELEEQDAIEDDSDSTPKPQTTQSFTTDPDHEDAMMSQLAAEITGDTKSRARSKTLFQPKKEIKQADPIQAILSSVGVSYTHENSEVIGSSRVEAHLSRRAEIAAESASASQWDTQQQEARVFVPSSQIVQQSGPAYLANGAADVYDSNGDVRYKFHPPGDVLRRQFCSMASWAGYGDIVEFASVVENWTQAERRGCLERWYRWRRDVLEGIIDGDLEGWRPDNVETGKNGNAVGGTVERSEDEDEDDEL